MDIRKQALKNKIEKVKKKTIDIGSDILSAPKRAYYGYKARVANADADLFKKARKYADMPDFNAQGNPTEGLKIRTIRDARASKYNK